MESTMGKRISDRRKALGLTQEGLAAEVGVSPQAVSKWENDQSCPDISMLPLLAKKLGMTTDTLLGVEWEEQQTPLTDRSGANGQDCDAENESMEDGFLSWHVTFGRKRHNVEFPLLRGGFVPAAFGSFILDLTGVKQVSTECELQLNPAFAKIEMLVPKQFRIDLSANETLSSVIVVGQHDAEPQGSICLYCNASFARVTIRYV